MIELSLTIEIYIAGVKSRAGFATGAYSFKIRGEILSGPGALKEWTDWSFLQT